MHFSISTLYHIQFYPHFPLFAAFLPPFCPPAMGICIFSIFYSVSYPILSTFYVLYRMAGDARCRRKEPREGAPKTPFFSVGDSLFATSGATFLTPPLPSYGHLRFSIFSIIPVRSIFECPPGPKFSPIDRWAVLPFLISRVGGCTLRPVRVVAPCHLLATSVPPPLWEFAVFL